MDRLIDRTDGQRAARGIPRLSSGGLDRKKIRGMEREPVRVSWRQQHDDNGTEARRLTRQERSRSSEEQHQHHLKPALPEGISHDVIYRTKT